MRNKVLHEYSGVDTSILWHTIRDDLPVVRQDVKKVLQS